jgi:membrane protease YdiL (CAAX protease family)
MSFDDQNATSAAPARARKEETVSEIPEETSAPGEPSASGSPSAAASESVRATPPLALPETPSPAFSNLQTPTPQLPSGPASDLRVPWGWQEVVLFVVIGLVGAVAVTRGLAEVVIRVFGISPDDIFGPAMTTAKSVVGIISQAILDVGAILFLYLMLLARTPERFWPTIGWRGLRRGGPWQPTVPQLLAGGAVLAFFVTFASAFFKTNETLPIDELLKARISIFMFGLLGVLLAPVVEETIFRGFLYPVIARRFGIGAGIVVTGTLFGLMHAAQLWGGWGQIALLVFVGITLTWVRARTGTVTASYFVHLGYNSLQLAGYLIYVAGGGMRH